MSARTVTAAGLSLPLISTGDGPRLDDRGELEGLATVINGFLNGVIPDLRDRVRAGEEASGGGLYAVELPDVLDPAVEGEVWRRLTGAELGDDAVMVGSSETPSFTLPRAALLEILDRMLDLRAMEAEHSLLARAVASRPGAPGRAEELARLEERVRELEAMTDPAEAFARRRVVLIEMDALGVLSAGAKVDEELRAYPVLAGYHAAARRLRAYLASGERRALLPEARPSGPLGAPVSLDWFRQDLPPTFERTAVGEAMLAASHPEDTLAGRFFAQWTGRWYEVVWRRDDGETPALLELREP
jgi:hypothetical protein